MGLEMYGDNHQDFKYFEIHRLISNIKNKNCHEKTFRF